MSRALALVAISVLAGSFAAAQESRPPRGLYVYSYPAFIKNGDWEKALSATGIEGGAVIMKWSEIEPARGVYDFAEFDRRIQRVRSHGLSIELGILAGGNAPDWIYEPLAGGRGAARLDFAFSHHGGKGQVIRVTMAPPWDAVYQAAFAEMLAGVARHLREIDALQHVSVIKLTGVNTDTDEARLPAETPGQTHNPGVSDAIRTWTQAGYRPSLVVEAMRVSAAAWARAFPDKWLVLPIIPENSFPPIGENGQPVARGHAKGAIREMLGEVVAAAQKACPGRFILQMDWLMAGEPVRPTVMEIARKLDLPVAWQTNFYYGHEGKGAACGGEFGHPLRCDDATFLKLLEAGIRPEGGSGPNATGAFIEIFPPDVIQFKGAMIRAREEMFR